MKVASELREKCRHNNIVTAIAVTVMMDLQHTSLRTTTVFVNFMRTCMIPKTTNLSTLDWEIASAYSIVIVSWFFAYYLHQS